MVNPIVSMPGFEKGPTPKRLVSTKRNRVEATLNVTVTIAMLVWKRLRLRSLVGKLVLIILQSPIYLLPDKQQYPLAV